MSRAWGHVEDDSWVRLCDRQASPLERLRAGLHARRCAPCAARRDAMTRRLARLDALLADDARPAGAPPAGAGDARVGHARALGRAAVLLLGGSAVAYAAITQRLPWPRGDAPAGSRAVGAPAGGVAARPEAPDAHTRLRFVPERDTLVLSFSAAPTAGALVVTRDADGPVELDLGASRRPREVVLLPDGVRVELDGGRVDATLRLPARLRAVRVQVDGGAPRTIGVTEWPSGAARRVPWPDATP